MNQNFNGYQQFDINQVSNQYNSVMNQLQGQIQTLNDRMGQIQSQFQQQYPQLFQPQQQPQPQQIQQPVQNDVVSCISVTSLDEVKAQTPLPVGKKLFTNFKKGELFAVYFDNDGNKVIDTFSKNKESKSVEEPQSELATTSDIKYLFDYIKSLESRIEQNIGGINNDARANIEVSAEQSTNGSNVSKVARQSKSNARVATDDKSE